METPASGIAGPEGDRRAEATLPRYQIGAVAERTELSHTTLRHWHEAGLVSPSGRSEGGFRLYSDADIERILVIRRMKPIGFTLEQMQQLLDVLQSSRSGPEERAAARATLQEFAQQTQQSLDRIRRHLAYGTEFAGLLADLLRASAPEGTPTK